LVLDELFVVGVVPVEHATGATRAVAVNERTCACPSTSPNTAIPATSVP
jgi:hypothetical protein